MEGWVRMVMLECGSFGHWTKPIHKQQWVLTLKPFHTTHKPNTHGWCFKTCVFEEPREIIQFWITKKNKRDSGWWMHKQTQFQWLLREDKSVTTSKNSEQVWNWIRRTENKWINSMMDGRKTRGKKGNHWTKHSDDWSVHPNSFAFWNSCSAFTVSFSTPAPS